jgi:predicted amidohydrolase YtcJ
MMYADLILMNGRVWTGNPDGPAAEAVAVLGDRIASVGTSAEIGSMAGPHTRCIDLAGRRLVPGFNDAHIHMFIGGDSLASVQLRDASGPEQLRERVAKFASECPEGEWLLNGSWDHERWSPAVLPHHTLIDSVTERNPAFLNRSDGHTVLVNRKAMEIAGVTDSVVEVPGGEIGRDANGRLTGIFKDAAKSLFERHIPRPSNERIRTATLAGQAYALENGVTSVQDMGLLGEGAAERMIDVIRVYQQMYAAGELRVRISAHIPLPEWRRAADAGIQMGLGTSSFRVGALKSFSDGSLGSTTAWFTEPYTDVPSSYGVPSEELVDPISWYDNLRQSDQAGLQIAIHAIGDRANHTVLNAIQKLIGDNGPRDRRIRIEHAQHLLPMDFARFRELGVIASVQPYHCVDDGCWVERRIGSERAQRTYAFRSLLDAGCTVAFGTDWWVAPINPLMTIDAAVNRRTLDGRNPEGWMPQECVTVEEAIHAYTVASAYASGEENLKGSIARGKLADMAVLSRDPFSIPKEEIGSITVDLTVLGGVVVFERLHEPS